MLGPTGFPLRNLTPHKPIDLVASMAKVLADMRTEKGERHFQADDRQSIAHVIRPIEQLALDGREVPTYF